MIPCGMIIKQEREVQRRAFLEGLKARGLVTTCSLL
jgi:hypothetical protein